MFGADLLHEVVVAKADFPKGVKSGSGDILNTCLIPDFFSITERGRGLMVKGDNLFFASAGVVLVICFEIKGTIGTVEDTESVEAFETGLFPQKIIPLVAPVGRYERGKLAQGRVPTFDGATDAGRRN